MLLKSRGGLIAAGVVAALIALIAVIVWWTQRSSATDSTDDDTTVRRDGSGARVGVRPTGRTPTKVGGKRIAGIVLLDGAPVADATVFVVSRPGTRGLAPASRKRTDASGRFDFGEISVASYVVVAEKQGLTNARVAVDLRDPNLQPPAHELQLAMHPCDAALHGVIRDVSGGPIAKATVGMSYGGSGSESDDEGRYEICIPVGNANVVVEADGYARVHESIAAYGRVRRDFELVPEAIVTGRVVRADDNSPVAGAELTLQPDASRRTEGSWAAGVSDDDGQFRIDGLTAGDYIITAKAEHLATREGTQVTAEVGVQQPLTVELKGTLVIAGKVIERGGKPISGAVIRTIEMDGGARMTGPGEARSQSDGTFELDAFPGRYMAVVAGYSDSRTEITLGNEDKRDVVIEVEVGASVAGRITCRGKPADDTMIRIGSRSATTDVAGRFVVRGLEPGEHPVYAESKRLGAFSRDKRVTVGKAEQRTGYELDLDLSGSIEGVVVDQAGKPVSGVSLELSLIKGQDFGAATTADDGSFKVGALSGGGDYGYLVRSLDQSLTFPPVEGKRFPPITVRDGSSHVTGVRIAIRYERQTISGRVLSTKGTPIPDMLVRAEPAKVRWTAPSTRSTVDGAFSFRDLPAGTYTVRASGPRGTASVANIKGGQRDVVLRVPEPGSVTVTLENFTGPVNVFMYTSEDGRYSTTTSTTTATLRNVSPGDYMIHAATTAGEMVSSKLTVGEGAAAKVTLRSPGFASVAITVVDEDGKPVTDATCSVGYQQRRQKVDGNGQLRVDKVGVGQNYVSCMQPTRNVMGGQAFELAAGGTMELRVVMKNQDKEDRRRGVMGFQMTRHLDDLVVSSITPGGPAEKAGLAVGDILEKVNDKDFEDGGDALYGEPGSTVKLTIERDDKERTITLTLGTPP